MSKKLQVHKRIVLLFMKEVFDAYINARITLSQGIEMLMLWRSNFFRYLKAYRHNPTGFGITYSRKSANRKLPADSNYKIAELLRKEKELVADPVFKVRKVNFHALADELKKQEGITVSPETIRRKAIEWNLHKPIGQ